MRLSHSHNRGYVTLRNRNAPGQLEEKMVEFKNTENQIEQSYDSKSTFTKIKVNKKPNGLNGSNNLKVVYSPQWHRDGNKYGVDMG